MLVTVYVCVIANAKEKEENIRRGVPHEHDDDVDVKKQKQASALFESRIRRRKLKLDALNVKKNHGVETFEGAFTQFCRVKGWRGDYYLHGGGFDDEMVQRWRYI